MKTYITVVPHLVAAFMLLSCDESNSNQPASAAKTETKKPTVPKPIMPQTNIKPEPPSEAAPAIESSTAKSAFAAVVAKRKGDKAEEGSAEFERLLRQWNPRGKTVQEVKTVIGKPDWENETAFGYRFDSGWGGWEWSLSNDGKAVIDVKRTGID